MNRVVLEQPVRGLAHALSPESGERRAGDLDDATQLGPLHYALRALAQNRIALRMRDDCSDAAIAKLGETVRGLLRDAVIVQLHQHVMSSFDGVARGIGEHGLQVVIRKMKIAAETDLDGIADEALQVINERLEINAVVVIAIVGVWRGNLVRNTVGRGHAAHGDGGLPGFRSVVYFRKNVRMNVDHDCWNTMRAELACIDLSRFAGKEKVVDGSLHV